MKTKKQRTDEALEEYKKTEGHAVLVLDEVANWKNSKRKSRRLIKNERKNNRM